MSAYGAQAVAIEKRARFDKRRHTSLTVKTCRHTRVRMRGLNDGSSRQCRSLLFGICAVE